jgi:hypothetical protein
VWGSGIKTPPFLISALDRDEWSASRPGRLTPRERAPGTHLIGSWVGPRADLDDVEKRKFLALPGLELRPLCRPACSQLLYRQRYRGSLRCRNCVFKYLDEFNASRSRNSAVGIATGYGLDDREVGVRVPVETRFLLSRASRPALGSTQLLIQWVPRSLSAGIKRPGPEADSSPPTSIMVKNTWIYTSTSPYVFMA